MSLKLEQNLELWLNGWPINSFWYMKTIPNHKQLRIAYEETMVQKNKKWIKKFEN
jgi:hypothetical protein